MNLVDIPTLASQLAVIAAVTKTLVELIKLNSKVKASAEIKQVLSFLIPVIITVIMQIGLIDTANQVAFYIGCVASGLIAGLGSNFIHEILESLQTLKSLKK